MSVHLTPTELADEMHMKRRDVLTKCIEMNVPDPQGPDRQDPLRVVAAGVPDAEAPEPPPSASASLAQPVPSSSGRPASAA